MPSDTASPSANGKAAAQTGGVSGGQLKSIVERIERLEEEKAAIAADIRDIYAEAKANGFDAKVLRQVVKLRKMDQTERQEQESLLDVYLHALGMA
ncbi:MAG: DUF2312 domain-containing protein [Alphaproteobacteria bacterium]